ncbi:hypothetical protein [Faecalibacillus intestinalis]|nr:hypothetical protein [Faecalibacillus intestinalis]MCQ5066736.1 hypothetical protein [Faecalibacillus intestinalis]
MKFELDLLETIAYQILLTFNIFKMDSRGIMYYFILNKGDY